MAPSGVYIWVVKIRGNHMTIRKVKKLLRAYAQKSLEQYMNDEILAKLLAYAYQFLFTTNINARLRFATPQHIQNIRKSFDYSL